MNTLDYAILMELDGEKYYREQALLNQGNELCTVCNLLAREEKRHAEILELKKQKLPYTLQASDFLENAKNIYAGSKGIIADKSQAPNQLDFYRSVCDMEQKSIDLYQGFLSEADNEEDKQLFEYLIKQEKQHLEAFEDMSRMLENASWWVESAEFGLRRDKY